jgi:hypothetical protein
MTNLFDEMAIKGVAPDVYTYNLYTVADMDRAFIY